MAKYKNGDGSGFIDWYLTECMLMDGVPLTLLSQTPKAFRPVHQFIFFLYIFVKILAHTEISVYISNA